MDNPKPEAPSTEELIKQVRDPSFSGSELCFTLADRLASQQQKMSEAIGSMREAQDLFDNISAHHILHLAIKELEQNK